MPIVHDDLHPKREKLPLACANGVIISIEQLTFDYPDGHTALHDICVQIKQGEKVALVGPNGAGKSTLMLHLNGILKGVGNIRIAGLTLDRKNTPIIRAAVGMVFQNPDDQLFSPTVFEDVAFGPLHMGVSEAEIQQRVTRALEQVGMSHYANRLSHHLSIGEKKRISIATVLSMEPQILALDEPTSGLDPRARRSLINLLREMPITMLVSTHDMRMVEDLCPRIVVMDGGRIIADGSTEEILADDGLLEAHGLERPHFRAPHAELRHS
ncbi:MAG: energy-coupling factor ABC transporter ATP-binding protein [Chloroflexi bacterium]|nr:energy-coupling factor ABC transporter ATP-binding protein [Chloroflexota bacterium]